MRLPAPKLFIDGAFAQAEAGETIDVIDPSIGETFAAIARGRKADIDRAVAAARRALNGSWGKLSAAERGRMLMRLGRRV
jgi:aldehyde dehydrogenase (NAD+)